MGALVVPHGAEARDPALEPPAPATEEAPVEEAMAHLEAMEVMEEALEEVTVGVMEVRFEYG